MKELFDIFIQNLTLVGCGMAIFLCAYLANMCFSLYHNISQLEMKWDWKKFWDGVIKAVDFLVGLTLLCAAITALPFFANKVGWVIPDEYAEVFADIAIIAVILTVSCKYCIKAFNTFKEIIDFSEDLSR